ncbi:hypothetical protein LTR62_005038 [Meristemomyces frigidus]|uniref:Laccase n=1 Tax=Meristemomyces frigidus TaxID=1508187 RepID=A0AAN7YJD6_9PEZI|nr:hypothetical protein LTR62_005038 [Meristemomyces frigidus]
MGFVEHFVATITYVVSYFSFTSNGYESRQQTPLFDIPNNVEVANPPGPIFKPPTGRPSDLPGGDLLCDYTKMRGFESCSTPEDRGCWLHNPTTGQQYNITTDYENVNNLPQGIDRYYTLKVSDGHINADGLDFPHGKFFWEPSDPDSYLPDRRYPGPCVQACWGDAFNGTTIHWHGIRQLNTTEADGVPGITQCPIAPGDNFTYTFTARQYGSSWYHSHYSLQYADGAAGPLTIHGPDSGDWDEPKFPILMTDWGHNSAFEAIWSGTLNNQSTLLNGRGNITRFHNSIKHELPIPNPYNISVSSTKVSGRPQRYLLRLINTSFESFFTFAVDNHTLTVISTDFVSIHPYVTNNVTIGIGQRYNVILTAQPINSSARSFWMRAYRPNCFFLDRQGDPGYEKAGLVFYDGATAEPDSSVAGWPIVDAETTACHDEPYDKIHPIVPWIVSPKAAKEEDSLVVQAYKDPGLFPLATFSIGGEDFNPLAIDYSNPTVLNLANDGLWPPRWVVFPENYTETDWVFLVLKGTQGPADPPSRSRFRDPGARQVSSTEHPQSRAVDVPPLTFLTVANNTFSLETANLKFDNPPRRDVVLLPANGYAVIAFRTDNPGSWLMHCHIAQHASFGLALQILERRTDSLANGEASGMITQAQKTCNKWNKWYGDCNNWWWDTTKGSGQYPGFWCDGGLPAFSPDSGI